MLLRRGGGVLAARLGQAALNALAGWFVAGRLGPEAQGAYTLSIFVIMVVSSVVNGGVGLAAVPVLRKGEASLAAVIRAQVLWCTAVCAGLGVAVVVAWRVGAHAALDSALGWGPTETVTAGVAVGALLLFDVLVYNLNARGRVLDGPLVNLGRAALFLAAVSMLLGRGEPGRGWQSVLVVYAGAQTLAMVVVLIRVWSTAERPATPTAEPATALMKSLVRHGWVGQLSSVVSLLHLRLDLALVAWWHGIGIVGVYSVAVMIGELLWLISGALQPILVYTASAVDDPKGRDQTTARAVRLGFFVTALAGVSLWIVAPHLLGLLFGDAYSGAIAPLRALLPGIIGFSAGAVLAGDFIGRGRPAWNTQASLLTVVVNLGTGLWLIPAHGALGAAWASTAAYLAGTMLMLIRFRHGTNLTWWEILRPRSSDILPS